MMASNITIRKELNALSMMASSITIKNVTLSIMIFSTMAVLLCWVSLMLNVANNPFFAKCRYAECYFAECQYAECRGALFKWLKKLASTENNFN